MRHADDHAQTRQLLSRILKAEGHDVRLADSCAAVEDAIHQGPPFDVLVLDVMLPDGSGIDLCARLRGAEFRAPILLLTSL